MDTKWAELDTDLGAVSTFVVLIQHPSHLQPWWAAGQQPQQKPESCRHLIRLLPPSVDRYPTRLDPAQSASAYTPHGSTPFRPFGLDQSVAANGEVAFGQRAFSCSHLHSLSHPCGHHCDRWNGWTWRMETWFWVDGGAKPKGSNVVPSGWRRYRRYQWSLPTSSPTSFRAAERRRKWAGRQKRAKTVVTVAVAPHA